MTEAEMLGLGLDFAANRMPGVIETISDWLAQRGVTPDQMHAALTEAGMRRQKTLKAFADDAAFGPRT